MPHSVGLRIMIDTMLNGNDAAPFRIPGLGDVTNETLLTGAAVPSYWQAFNSLANAAIASQGTLRGADATTPDRFGVFNWSSIDSQLWDYTPPLNNPTGDSAVAMWWDPVNLAPGGALTLVTYYGLGSQTVVTGGSLAVGITAPASPAPWPRARNSPGRPSSPTPCAGPTAAAWRR